MIDFDAAAAGIARTPEPEPQDPEEALRAKLFGSSINENGSLRCVSPSQIKTHKRCKRAWYYDKKLKLPRKEKGKGAKLGTECHKRMEDWLRTGVDVRGPLERHGHEMIAPYLARAPFNGGDMLVEAPLLDPQLMTPGGIRISGFSDVTLPPVHSTAVVLDHKFKKKLEQYAETEEQLAAGDPQAVIYSAWALTKWPDALDVYFQHSNHQTEGPRLNKPVAITDDRATVFEKWAKLGKYIDEEMAATAHKEKATDVEAAGDTDPSACRAFGGCDFLSVCPSSPHNRYMNGLALPDYKQAGNRLVEPPTQGYDLMGLLDEMEQNAAAAPTATVPAARTKLPALEASDCKTGGVYMIPGGPVGKFEGVLGDRAIFKDVTGGLLQCAPDDLVRDLNGDPVVVANFEPKKKKLTITDVMDTTPKIDPKAGIVPKDAPADTNPPKEAAKVAEPAKEPAKAAESAPSTESEPKKAGRPAGSKNKPKAETGGLIILVNNACPAAEDLQPYVQGLADAIAKKEGLVDLRLAPKTSDAAFNGYKALLAVAARTNPPPPGIYVVRSGDLADPIIEALSSVGIVSFGGGR